MLQRTVFAVDRVKLHLEFVLGFRSGGPGIGNLALEF